MARCDFANFVGPTPNRTVAGMLGYLGLVLHRAQGGFAGTEQWLENPQSQASADFALDNMTGQLDQLLDTHDKAWAEASGNPYNLSVEITGFVGDAVADVAVNQLGRLYRWTYDVHGVALAITEDPNGRGLKWHGMGGAAWGGHPDCPGAVVLGLRPRILAIAQGLYVPPTPSFDDGRLLVLA